MILHQPARYLLDVVFPPRCGHCAGFTESQGKLCSNCWSALTFLSAPCCAACGYPFAYEMADADSLCASCMQHKPHYDGHRSMLKFDEHSKKLIHDLKYHDKPLLLDLFGEWLMRAGNEFWDDNVILMPIPLHFLRLWQRRYNQAALLAKALAKRSGHALMLDGLKRVKRRPPQAGLSREQRLKNMRGVFATPLKCKAAINGKTIVLVDDVMTTGATLNACARTLKRAGASRVYAVTLARTVLE
jgi:ComF family protein